MLMRCDYANDNLIVTELLKNERQIFIIEHDNYSQLIMIETTLKVEGMACPMCESHLKDVMPRSMRLIRKPRSRSSARASPI